MKALFLWILILSIAVGLPVTPVAIAKPNKADKAVATQQPDKLRTQIRRNSGSGAEDHRVTVIAQKTRKSVSTDTRIKKNSSSINGTTIHRKH
jgi:hypothetical protein